MNRGLLRSLFALLVGIAAALPAAVMPAAADPVEKSASSDVIMPPQVETIDRLIRQGWKDFELTPSEPATDGEWCRRVYLDVLGRIPRVKELDAFLEGGSNRRAKLINKLLGEEHNDEYTKNWSTLWTNILIGRSGGTERRSLTNRDGMRGYLRDTFQQNKPYDEMVYELVSATGTSKPGLDDYNGAVNFLAMKLTENGTSATSDTSRIFLGTRVQCTQCHDHPFNNWRQNAFWEFNAFFRQTAALRRFDGQNVDHIELVDQDYGGEGGDAEEAEIYYERRNGLMKVAYPVFRDRDGKVTELPVSGFVEDVNRREELAKLITGSGYMPRTIANRMWSHFLGFGFTKPPDDMGPHNAPSHPELMDYLGEEFKKADFDLKELIRWIALSEAYSLSSSFNDGNVADDPTLGNRPMFSRFYLRQMRAEELYESLLVATLADKTRGSDEEQEEARAKWLGQFVIAFGTDENDETTTFDGTIPQTLMMFNGELVKQATSGEKGSFLERVSTSPKLKGTAKLNYLYRAALARKPTSAERTAANRILKRHRDDQVAALQDIWWAMLNTNEFILNH